MVPGLDIKNHHGMPTAENISSDLNIAMKATDKVDLEEIEVGNRIHRCPLRQIISQ